MSIDTVHSWLLVNSPVQTEDKWTGTLSCWPRNADTCGQPDASVHEDRHPVCLSTPSTPDFWWLIGRTLASPSWSAVPPCGGWEWTGRLQVVDLLSSWEPETTDCRIPGTSRWWLALWLPSSARHRRLAEDPVGCSWSGNWCFDGWAEVAAGMQCPPHPRRCWWPGSCPADSASAGQSLPGEPPPRTRQRYLVEVAEEALPDFLLLGRVVDGPFRRQLERAAPVSQSSDVEVRGPQAVKHWRSWSRFLGWRHFLAGLGFSLLREERQRRASYHVGLPDGTDTILKDLWFGTHHMVSLKRCRPHNSKNLGLEVEVLQKSVSTQQLQFWRGCKACRNHGNLSLLNNGQLLPEKFRAFILGGEFFNHWSHHRVSKRYVDGWPTSQLFCVHCPSTPDVTYGMKKGPCCYWICGHQEAWARRGHHGESWDGKVPWGKSAWPWRTWRRGSLSSVSDNVVLTTSSSSLSPCAIRAVEAMVSCRDGWSNHEILSVTSVSPRSNKEALDARLVFAGLSLN